jgi:predicted regulator of Ras-like GTPase activity (Roadblock/LC7/MglB family)
VQRLSADAENLNWLVSNFARRVPAVTSALVVSADGLLLAMSDDVDRSSGDQLSAAVSGLASLAQAASRCLHGKPVKQMIVEMEGEFLFVMSISDGSALCVMTGDDADLGFVGYEMGLLVSRVGDALTPGLRSELQSTLPW